MMIYKDIELENRDMKQLLVKLSDEEYQSLEKYCKSTGRTKSAVIRHQISKLSESPASKLLERRVKRIYPGKGKLLSELIQDMRT